MRTSNFAIIELGDTELGIILAWGLALFILIGLTTVCLTLRRRRFRMISQRRNAFLRRRTGGLP